MEDADNIVHARQQAIYSLLASEARITLERAKLEHMLERAEDATRRSQQQAGILNAAEHDRRRARRWYVEATQQLQSSSTPPPGDPAGITPARMPLSPSTPANAYTDANYPTTYEGHATMETFSIAAIIDNTQALNTRKHAMLEQARTNNLEHTYPAGGRATAEAILFYAPLIMAADEELRRMKEPIDLKRVDIDDLIDTFHADYLEHCAQAHT